MMLRFLPVLLLAPVLRAQTDFVSLFPAKPIFEIRVQKGEGLVAEFRKSKVGQVFFDEEMEEVAKVATDSDLWKRVGARDPGIDEIWRFVALLRDVIADSDAGAEVAVGVHGVDGPGRVQGWALCRVGGASAQLARIERGFRKVIGDAAQIPAGKVRVLGREVPVFKAAEAEARWTLPLIHEGSLYLFLSTDWKRDFGAASMPKQNSMLKDTPEPVAIAVDLAQYIGTALAQAEGGVGASGAVLLEGLGIQSLGKLEILFDIQKGRLLQEFRFELPKKGLIGDLMRVFGPREGKARALIRHIPEGAHVSDCGVVDLGEAYALITPFVEQVMGVQGMDVDVAAMFKNKFGFDLKTGLLDHLDGRISSHMHLDAEEVVLKENHVTGDGTMTVCLGVRDAVKFGKSVDTVIRKMGLHVSRKKKTYRGVDLYRFKFLGWVELHYGLTKDLFIGAYGTKGQEVLSKIIDRELELAGGAPGFVPDVSLKSQLAMAPQSLSGLRIANLMTTMTTLMRGVDLVGDTPGEPGILENLLRATNKHMLPLLRKHGLENLVFSMGRERNSLRIVTIW